LSYRVFDTDPDQSEQFDMTVAPTYDGFNLKLTLAAEPGKYDLSMNDVSLVGGIPRQLQQAISSIGAI
jgi:hypothetical protein